MDRHSQPLVYIYSLADPHTGEIRYVGKTKDPKSRVRTHVNHKERTYKSHWLQTLSEDPVLQILDEVPESEWKFWEVHWIQVMAGWGFRLTNGDKGGLGRDRFTQELKQKISESLSGRPNIALSRRIYCFHLVTGQQIGSYASVNAAAKAVGGAHPNIVRAMKNQRMAYGYAWSYDDLQAYALPDFVNGKYKATPQHSANLTAAMLGRKMPPVSESTRQKMRNSALNRCHS